MIGESRYYKDELLHFTHAVRRWLKHSRFTDRRWYEFERGLLTSCLAIRRLIECHKIADDLAVATVPVSVYGALGKVVTVMNRHDLPELYDVENPKTEQLPIGFVANQIIHSFVLNYWREVDRSSITVFFSSDRERNKRAYSVTTSDLFPLFDTFGSDYPDVGNMKFNSVRGDYDVTLSTTQRVILRPRRRSQLT